MDNAPIHCGDQFEETKRSLDGLKLIKLEPLSNPSSRQICWLLWLRSRMQFPSALVSRLFQVSGYHQSCILSHPHKKIGFYLLLLICFFPNFLIFFFSKNKQIRMYKTSGNMYFFFKVKPRLIRAGLSTEANHAPAKTAEEHTSSSSATHQHSAGCTTHHQPTGNTSTQRSPGDLHQTQQPEKSYRQTKRSTQTEDSSKTETHRQAQNQTTKRITLRRTELSFSMYPTSTHHTTPTTKTTSTSSTTLQSTPTTNTLPTLTTPTTTPTPSFTTNSKSNPLFIRTTNPITPSPTIIIIIIIIIIICYSTLPTPFLSPTHIIINLPNINL
ncbi:hypothetical protein VP01_175g3 [Puccinia sorghi]|uniref:Uncharacterized protein n=1 Tax=Puccinia sorghi TaxID=27349 RepID=A0A0L6VFI3_9BASI|nr:hypothetical protein VP01_175g3 [Puccinia sorghi]